MRILTKLVFLFRKLRSISDSFAYHFIYNLIRLTNCNILSSMLKPTFNFARYDFTIAIFIIFLEDLYLKCRNFQKTSKISFIGLGDFFRRARKSIKSGKFFVGIGIGTSNRSLMTRSSIAKRSPFIRS